MILIDATIKYKGYSPLDLSKGSHKRICISCNECGRVRYVEFCQYRKLCKSCAFKGKRNGFYDKSHTLETLKLQSEGKLGNKNPMYGKRGNECGMYGRINSKNPAWRGGFNRKRPYLKPINKCIQLNKRFNGSHAHHIMSGVIIYIPKNIHRSIYHNFRCNINIKIINKLSLNYLMGDFDEF